MTSYRLYPSTNGPSSSSGDSTSYVMGVSFKVTITGQVLQGYWWWVADSSQNAAPKNFALWTSTGPSVGGFVAGSETTSGTLSLGWNFTALTPNLALTQNQEYRAVVSVTPGSVTTGYSVTSHWYSSGNPGGNGITVGPLFAWSGNGGSSNTEPQGDGQMTFSAGGSDVTADYPSNSFNDANYWLDVQVGPPFTPQVPTVVYSMRTFP